MAEATYSSPKVTSAPAAGVQVKSMNIVFDAGDRRVEVHIEDLDASDNVVGAFRVDVPGGNDARLLLQAADSPTAGEPATGYWQKRNYRILKHLKSIGVAPLQSLSL